jgi:hypothetical protein
VPIYARRQSIRDCSTERRDEADRIDAHNPLTNKYGSGIRNRLDSIDRLRNAERGPRELRIPKRSSLVAELLTSQQGVFKDHTSRQCNGTIQLRRAIYTLIPMSGSPQSTTATNRQTLSH